MPPLAKLVAFLGYRYHKDLAPTEPIGVSDHNFD
jgi:hypothetical protein